MIPFIKIYSKIMHTDYSREKADTVVDIQLAAGNLFPWES